MPPEPDNGFDQYKRLILGCLEDGKAEREQIVRELTNLRIAFEGFSAGMKVKAGVWGALAGLIPAVGILLVALLRMR